jgi:Fumarylacetoacetate (FAA) hydrolase family
MRLATFSAGGRVHAGVVSDAGLHPLPGTTVLDLVRGGLPAALEAGQQALGTPAVPLVNGVEVGQDLLSNMGWPFEDLISYASRGTWVRAGDVLGSGTCGNGGCLAELWGRRGRIDPPPLRPGDLVEMTVEGIGTIRNTVVPGPDLPLVRPARPRPRIRKRTP